MRNINEIYPKGHKKAGKPLDRICIIGDNDIDFTSDRSFWWSKLINYRPIRKPENEYRKAKRKFVEELCNKILNNGCVNKEKEIAKTIEWSKKHKHLKVEDKKQAEEFDKKYEITIKIIRDILPIFGLNLMDTTKSWNGRGGLIIEYNGGFLPYCNDSRAERLIWMTEDICITNLEKDLTPQEQIKVIDVLIKAEKKLVITTNSPIILSRFEPWEVFKIVDGKRELFYKGENHIDNYTLDPRLLTWTGILTDIFDLKDSSNSNLREQKLIEFNILKEEIKNIVDIEKKEKLFKKLQNMGKKLGIYNQ